MDSWNTSKTNVSVVINIKAHTWHRHRHAKFIKVASQMIKEFMQVKKDSYLVKIIKIVILFMLKMCHAYLKLSY